MRDKRASGGFKLQAQDRSGQGMDALQAATQSLAREAATDLALASVFSPFRAATPQLHADVDRVKARMLDVPITGVFETLQVSLGSLFVNEFN